MKTDKPTCGPLYKEALEKYCGGDPDKIQLFAAGFVSGQAEKVYLGACQAAMFRPSPEYQDVLRKIVSDACQRYGLECTTHDGEIWILRNESASRNFLELVRRPLNSAGWHRLRARLCGIPNKEIDERFHERKGYGERCD